MNNLEHAPPLQHTPERQLRPAPIREIPDWRRLEVALARHGELISDGIAYATEHHTGINKQTAECIAHVLGRSIGPESALAEYALTGEGDYEALRDEYLAICNNPEAPAWAVELVDYFGSRLIFQTFPEAANASYQASHSLKLARLHVPTKVTVDGLTATVHVPGIYGRETIAELPETLSELQLAEDEGLQAFLSIPSVNVVSGNIMEGFHNCYVGVWRDIEEAVTELCLLDDREEEIKDFAAERKLYFDYLSPDYEALQEELEETFTFAEKGGRVYVFNV